MTETSDPIDPDGTPERRVTLGGREEPASGDPTAGGKRGDIGEVPSIAADEPDDGSSYPVGGGGVGEESDAVPHADAGPDGTP
ncbi:hypothetical protein [Modestobacter roseus]|uniref:Uncharacterized protein n=1 Tax=Modestobacter roseus TaxID=1181884 RepID=A0A562ISF6_9ACTN|nr:hypothetical protein [Modestobacter roseus]MQA35555.1 hypothetical protein [Modestobacter roseus]TWH73842.1 hypothetical protein JD78_02371 [Modestobacter roseus]